MIAVFFLKTEAAILHKYVCIIIIIIKVDYKPPLFTYYLTIPWIQMQFSPTYGSDVIERISDDVN